jgi:hypothetical protein|eukprot:COSAG02_NODE_4635_length_5143_cov_9.278152_5_plen_46_part_00
MVLLDCSIETADAAASEAARGIGPQVTKLVQKCVRRPFFVHLNEF